MRVVLGRAGFYPGLPEAGSIDGQKVHGGGRWGRTTNDSWDGCVTKQQPVIPNKRANWGQ